MGSFSKYIDWDLLGVLWLGIIIYALGFLIEPKRTYKLLRGNHEQ